MKDTALKIKDISKQYRLGVIGTGTLSHDLNRWWHKIRGKKDPYLKIGSKNVLDSVDDQFVWALSDINIDIKKGDVLGIVGKNGAGKSTLLKILSRVTSPTTGSIKINGRIASLLEVGTGFHPELTGKENIYLNGAILGMTKHEISGKIDEIIDFSGLRNYIDTPVKRYSSGMYVRLAFAVAAHLEPEILVVDEVLAVGDAEFQKKAIGKMKDVSASGRTVLFVSHNLAAVEQLCSRAVLIEQGTITQDGEVADILNAYRKSTAGDGSLRRHGVGQVRFNEYQVLDKNDKQINEVMLGESAFVNTEIEFTQDVDHADLSIDIRNDSNEFISHISCDDDDFKIDNYKNGDKKKLIIEIKNISLAPGTYFLSLWLGNRYGTFDYLENAINLRVGQGDNFIKRPYPFDKRSKTVLQSKWTLLK